MKKIISVIICMLVVVSVFGFGSISSVAAQKKAVIYADDVSGNPGDTVYTRVKIENNPGFSDIAFTLNFDKSVLSYFSTNGELLEGYSIFDHSKNGKITVAYTGEENIEGGSTLVCFEFKIKQKAKTGKSPLKLNKIYIKNADSQAVKYDTKAGSVKVSKACKGEHSYNTWQAVIPSTCKKDGVKCRFCDKCGHEENKAIPSEGHRIDRKFTIDVIAEGSKPGMLSRHCSVCGAKTSIITYTEKNDAALSLNDALDTFDDDMISALVHFLNGGRVYPEIKYDVTDVERFILLNSGYDEDDANYKSSRDENGKVFVDVAVDKILRRTFGDDTQAGILTMIKRAVIADEVPLGIISKLFRLIFI